MDNERRAKDLAKYYFRLIAVDAGIEWTSDNDVEIEELIDFIIQAAIDSTVTQVYRNQDRRGY